MNHNKRKNADSGENIAWRARLGYTDSEAGGRQRRATQLPRTSPVPPRPAPADASRPAQAPPPARAAHGGVATSGPRPPPCGHVICQFEETEENGRRAC